MVQVLARCKQGIVRPEEGVIESLHPDIIAQQCCYRLEKNINIKGLLNGEKRRWSILYPELTCIEQQSWK